MGDRANVKFIDEGELFLYSHWGGYELPETVQKALKKEQRWDDGQYLSRIIFCEMIGGDRGTTGFGISTYLADNGRAIITVDVKNQTVSIKDKTWSFSEYCQVDDFEDFH